MRELPRFVVRKDQDDEGRTVTRYFIGDTEITDALMAVDFSASNNMAPAVKAVFRVDPETLELDLPIERVISIENMPIPTAKELDDVILSGGMNTTPGAKIEAWLKSRT